MNEIESLGVGKDALSLFETIVNLNDNDTATKFNCLKEIIGETEAGAKGIFEMKEIFELTEPLNISNEVKFDLSLARGLNYYTGTIFEVVAADVKMGSICGGGRYDDLTGIFGLKDMSGVGVSFGADRIYDVLNELEAFPPSVAAGTRVMLVNFGETEARFALGMIEKIRAKGISAELYPDAVKLKKQMNYADKNNIAYVLMVGKDEIDTGIFTLKDMENGEQKKLSFEQIIDILR